MSKLKELIAELCPNGVEYVKFDKICAYIRGITYNKSKEAKANDFNPWKVLRANNITLSSNTLNFDDIKLIKSDVKVKQEQFLKKNDILICAGSGSKEHIGKVAFITSDMEYTFGGFMAVIRCDSQLNSRYMYHILTGDIFKKYLKYALNSTTINNLNMSVMANFQFPVPPLPVQEEIVRILDSFTSLTAELQTKLQAELQARQKQYEYYRDQLLTFDVHGGGTSEVQWKTLSEVCDIFSGKNKEKKAIGIYPVYGSTGIIAYCDQAVYHDKSILLARVGANAGYVQIAVGEYDVSDNTLIVFSNSEVNFKYLFYQLQKMNLRQFAKGAGQPLITAGQIKKLHVPVPPLPVQEKIVEVLDNFDAICSDLNIGLPAEIEARQKQYEYYRDALLSFNCSHSVNVERERERALNKLLQYVFGYVMMPLSEVATCFRGEYITKKSTKPGNVPVILGGQEPAYFIHESNHVGEIVVVARSGASAGFVSYWNEAVFITDGFGYEADEKLMLPKYLFYTLKNKEKQLNAMKRGAGVPHVSGENLASILLSVPTLEQQKKIISILDRFETLCNDMTAGLPAEIEARQKQYEYYRDRLLSFPKLT